MREFFVSLQQETRSAMECLWSDCAAARDSPDTQTTLFRSHLIPHLEVLSNALSTVNNALQGGNPPRDTSGSPKAIDVAKIAAISDSDESSVSEVWQWVLCDDIQSLLQQTGSYIDSACDEMSVVEHHQQTGDHVDVNRFINDAQGQPKQPTSPPTEFVPQPFFHLGDWWTFFMDYGTVTHIHRSPLKSQVAIHYRGEPKTFFHTPTPCLFRNLKVGDHVAGLHAGRANTTQGTLIYLDGPVDAYNIETLWEAWVKNHSPKELTVRTIFQFCLNQHYTFFRWREPMDPEPKIREYSIKAAIKDTKLRTSYARRWWKPKKAWLIPTVLGDADLV